jgi:hypothetical protein
VIFDISLLEDVDGSEGDGKRFIQTEANGDGLCKSTQMRLGFGRLKK